MKRGAIRKMKKMKRVKL